MNSKDANEHKVVRSQKLLKEIITTPANFIHNEKLQIALKSQGRFAKFDFPEYEILPCSLNTLKTASDALLNRGFIELDELRANAIIAIEKAKVSTVANTKTRTGLKYKVAELKEKNLILMNRHSEMRNIVSLLKAELKKIAVIETEEQRLEQYAFITKKTDAMLSLGIFTESK
ncbi:hypothetical protein [Pseudoalteromonas distincta]|uniref:hypothetical protein n=1 Tax=Pseudoalteromonas distincta TaxID=77608 RepID=UPI00241D3695|nr:hypothetical protein [Pseudoalteromonas distincta]|tara:strand:+ start:29515 stop:30036 length:522 start_codon:yes stop_codon:yes gene_type:complete